MREKERGREVERERERNRERESERDRKFLLFRYLAEKERYINIESENSGILCSI